MGTAPVSKKYCSLFLGLEVHDQAKARVFFYQGGWAGGGDPKGPGRPNPDPHREGGGEAEHHVTRTEPLATGLYLLCLFPDLRLFCLFAKNGSQHRVALARLTSTSGRSSLWSELSGSSKFSGWSESIESLIRSL